MSAVGIALEIYLIAFVVGIFIAGLIKGMTSIIQRISSKKEAITEERK